jgi:D-alanyl-D-alanine carboxypeptidase (penicillin-binding protein 5/6)
MRSGVLAAGAAALASAALVIVSAPTTAAPTPTPAPAGPTATASPSPTLPTVKRRLDPSDSVGGPGLAPMDTLLLDAPAGVPAPPAVSDVAWLIADADTGEILAARNPHAPLLPASTLKALTAIHLLPRLDPAAVLTATAAEANAEGTRVGMVAGQAYAATQLFEALIMSSGNDAAYGLASLNGGVARTVTELNALADELGAHDTVVVDPSGLDAPGQQSSAYDLALIGRAAIANPDYVRIATTKASAFPAKAVRGATRPTYAIGNHNRLLWNYPGTIGVKNGFTKAAHRTFIGAARRNGKTYIVTEMYGTGSSWRPAASLLDWAFAHGDRVTPIGRLVDRGEVPHPLAAPAPAPDAGDQPTGRDGGDSGDDSSGSVVAAVTSPSGAVTPSLLPLAGGAALAALLIALRRRGRRQD